MILLTMLLIPIIVAFGFFLFGGKKVTFLEFCGQNALQVLVMLPFAFGSGCSSTADTEIWNGSVARKYSEKVSCSHSYQCNCYTSCSGSGKTRSCHRVCSTCYEHSYDVDWVVKTTNDEHIEIGRVNRQGTEEPSRWTAVQIGEPTSVTHGYENFVKASPDSLFRRQGLVEKYKDNIPSYPKTFDYYRMKHTIIVNGATLTNLDAYNKALADLNATLGKKKQVNIMLVAVKDLPHDYFYALEQAWIGSKKNDFVLVVGVDSTGKTQWADVLAWTENKMAEIVARDAVLKIGHINDPNLIVSVLESSVSQHYIRKPMKDFEYLKNAITPTFGTWIAAMIVGLISSIGLGIFFYNNGHDHEHETRRW